MVHLSQASKGTLIQETGFGSYDVGMNPYVGCGFGCSYCYVRFFIKDKEHPWGEFVRLRSFIKAKLPYEVKKAKGKRLCIGTMTDPYQPAELKHRLMRTTLTIIDEHRRLTGEAPTEIGIFTRSPLIKQDLPLLKKMNEHMKIRVHVTVTPFEPATLKRLEPFPIKTETRFKLVEEIKAAGLLTHISVSPALPIYSDGMTAAFAKRIAETQPNGFTVDPMQCYGEAFDATEQRCKDDPLWPEVGAILLNKKRYMAWKEQYHKAWADAWAPHIALPVFPVMMDHEKKTRTDLRDGKDIDFKNFSY